MRNTKISIYGKLSFHVAAPAVDHGICLATYPLNGKKAPLSNISNL